MFKILRLHYLAAILITLHLPLALLPKYRYSQLVIHHTASQIGDYKTIQRAHLKRYGGMAYHLLLSNGSANAPTGHLESGWRYFFFWYSRATKSMACNTMALHLCIVGNYEDGPVPDGLKPALAGSIQAICDQYDIPQDAVMLHRDCSATACPGKHISVEKIANWSNLTCSNELSRQHRAALRKPFLAGIPLGPLLLLSPFTALFSFAWICVHRRKLRSIKL